MEWLRRFPTFVAALCGIASGQGPSTNVMTTAAGTDWIFTGDGKPAASAPLGSVTGVIVDGDGSPILVDSDNCIVARIKDGVLSVVAGNGICTSSGEGGPAANAGLDRPYSAALDRQGNLVILGQNRIRSVSANRMVTLASIGSQGGVAVDGVGNTYFADSAGHVVRKITAGGVISTVAGNGISGASGDGGPATSARLGAPSGVAVDKDGNLYIADSASGLRKVATGGIIATIPTNALPYSVAFDPAGTLYVGGKCSIEKLPADATFPVPIAGSFGGGCGYAGDGGAARNALFRGPLFVAPDNFGNLYIADQNNHRLRKILSDGTVSTIAGNGRFRDAGEQVTARLATLNQPQGMVFARGALYFSEAGLNRVRRLSAGVLTTFAGSTAAGFSGDGGPATQALLDTPGALALDAAGNLYIADTGNNRVRKVTPQGIISTLTAVAGVGGLAFDDSAGALFMSSGNRILRLDAKGSQTLFAGGDEAGYSGDGGRAIDARLNAPTGLMFGRASRLYIADTGNSCVRRVGVNDPVQAGFITTFAGVCGKPGYAEGLLTHPVALAEDNSGNVYIADDGAGVVREVVVLGGLSTFAGGGPPDQLGDGKRAFAATLVRPAGIAFNGREAYIADAGSNRVRAVLGQTPGLDVSNFRPQFSAPSGGAPVTQQIAVTSTLQQDSIAGIDFSITLDIADFWLTSDVIADATPRVLTLTANPSKLAPGRYVAVFSFKSTAGQTPVLPVIATFVVGPPAPPRLSVDKRNLSTTFPNGAEARLSTFKVSNTGGGILRYSVSGETNNGGAWLSLPSPIGQAAPGTPTAVNVRTNPSGLGPGTYTGEVTVQPDTGAPVKIPVTMTVSAQSQALLLTQSGLSFTAVQGGGVIPPQSVGVINPGVGVLGWSASALTTSGGDWLTVTPASGSSDAAASAPQITLSVDANGLSAGAYYGVALVEASGAANTPQAVTVFLNVLPAGSDPGAGVQPQELVFFTTPGGGAPGSQTLFVYNVGGVSAKTFRTGGSLDAGPVLALPREGLLEPRQPTRVQVQPTGDFAAGVHTGALTFQFPDGRVQAVRIMVISSTTPPAIKPDGARSATDSSCSPTTLVPTITSLIPSFKSRAGWPVGLSVDVRDGCGAPHLTGTVTATFSSSEAPVPLQSLRNGNWQGTWQTQSGSLEGVTLTVEAVNPDLGISGAQVIEGSLDAGPGAPQFSPQTLGSAAGIVPFQPLAPGSLITINGTNLADFDQDAPEDAYPTRLGGTTVRIAYRPIPLRSVQPGRITAVIPYGLTPDTKHQIIVQRGDTISEAVLVDVAAAQPAIFVNPDTGWAIISPPGPVTAGDSITIWCAGLGVTDPRGADGQPGPSDPLAPTYLPVTVTMGGQNAEVKFAGLAPGLIGVYQVDTVAPSGIEPGDSVQLTLSIADQTSPAVSLQVR